MQNVPAKTATGSIGGSSETMDHTASTKTSHHITGRYGFHASVRICVP